MKNFRNEKLSEHLLYVDEEILANAYEVDDAEKLRAYIKTKRAKTKKPYYRLPAFRVAVAVAACAALILGILFSLPPKTNPSVDAPPEDTKPPVENLLPWQKEQEEPLSISSIDMLNYYTAMKMLADSEVTASRDTTGGTMVLSASSQSKKKYYYQLNPNETFFVSTVVFFRIKIENDDGFLASKVGTGIVDVVITENSLEPMITFKNGNRYYSCCQNAGNRKGKVYSSHKYIEGFNIVKNLEQENYSFTVIYDNFNLDYEDVTAKSLTCTSSTLNGGDAPDGELPIVGKTYISHRNEVMTVADLETYFNTNKRLENILLKWKEFFWG